MNLSKFSSISSLLGSSLGAAWNHLRLWWRLLCDPRVPETLKLLLPAVALIYGLWPVDILPDVIPILGQLDDITLILLLMNVFERLAPLPIVQEHLNRLRGLRQTAPAKKDDGDVIDAEYRVLR